MPPKSVNRKLTLSFNNDIHEFLDGRTSDLGITVSDYMRRLIGVAAIYVAAREQAQEVGYDSLLAIAPAFPGKESADQVTPCIIPDII